MWINLTDTDGLSVLLVFTAEAYSCIVLGTTCGKGCWHRRAKELKSTGDYMFSKLYIVRTGQQRVQTSKAVHHNNSGGVKISSQLLRALCNNAQEWRKQGSQRVRQPSAADPLVVVGLNTFAHSYLGIISGVSNPPVHCCDIWPCTPLNYCEVHCKWHNLTVSSAIGLRCVYEFRFDKAAPR